MIGAMTNADAATGQQEATETDSLGRPITRGNHAAKLQKEVDEELGLEKENIKRTYHQRQERARLLALHRRLVPEFRPAGGPTPKYDASWMPKRVYDLLSDPELLYTKKIVANHLGVAESTFREWRNIYPELSAAVAQGLANQEAWLGTRMAQGEKYSASIYAVLKNLHDWKEKTEDTFKLDIADALAAQEKGAKRVDWDRTRPDPLAARRSLPVIDAVPTDPAPPTHTPTPPPQPTGEGTHAGGDASAPVAA